MQEEISLHSALNYSCPEMKVPSPASYLCCRDAKKMLISLVGGEEKPQDTELEDSTEDTYGV